MNPRFWLVSLAHRRSIDKGESKWIERISKRNAGARARRRQGGQMPLVERQAEVREEAEGFNPPAAVSRVRLAAEVSPLAANKSAAAAPS
jgi:hypothetical protein